MTKRDWTLLAIAAADGEALSPVQLQKVLFLLGEFKLKGRNNFYNFIPYNYGPFDPEIYRDAEALEADRLVTVQAGGRWKQYAATPRGLALAERLNADADALDYLRRVVKWARSLTFQELVTAIYKRFPEYRVNSVFIRGRLEAINVHRSANIFKLYPRIGPTKLTGHFPESLRERIGLSLGKDVIARGKLKYRANEPHAYAIDVESVEIMPEPETLPSFYDLLGAAPDLTDDLSTEEWLIRRRAEVEPGLRKLFGL